MKKEQFLDVTHYKSCEQCGNVFYRDKRCTWRWWNGARFCSRECTGRNRSEDYMVNGPTLEEAFYKKVIKGQDSDCWRWSGSVDKDGYALVTHRAKQMRAPRVAIMLTGRVIGEGQQACHDCGNLWCVNPAHIYPGTPVQNNRDKIKHGTHRRGADCAAAKLTEQQAREAKFSDASATDLAKRFGVSSRAIGLIRAGKNWRNLK